MKLYSTWTGIWNFEKFTGGSLPTKVFLTDEMILYKSNLPVEFLDSVLQVFGNPDNWIIRNDKLYFSPNDYIEGDNDKLDSAKNEAKVRWEEII